MTAQQSIEAELAELRDLIAATEEWLAEDDGNWAARFSLAGLRSREGRLMAELMAATNRQTCACGYYVWREDEHRWVGGIPDFSGTNGVCTMHYADEAGETQCSCGTDLTRGPEGADANRDKEHDSIDGTEQRRDTGADN